MKNGWHNPSYYFTESLAPFFDRINECVLFTQKDGKVLHANLAFLNKSQSTLEALKEMSFAELFIKGDDHFQLLIDGKNTPEVMLDCLLPEPRSPKRFYVSRFTVLGSEALMLLSETNQKTIIDYTISIWESILDSTENAFTFISPDLCIQAFNDAADRQAELIIGRELHIGDNIVDYLATEEDKLIFHDHFKIALEGKKTSLINKVASENGDLFFNLNYNPVFGLDDEIIGVTLVAEDITDSKKLEAELKYREEIFRNTFNKIQDAALLWQKQPDGSIILARYNQAAEQITRGKISEWINMDLDELYAEQTQFVTRVKETFATGRSMRVESQVNLKTTGEHKWMLVDTIKISDEYVMSMTIDITDRKEFELALEEKQRQLSTLMSNLPGMAYRCANDPDWTMEFVSQGVQQLTGYSPEDLIGNARQSYGKIIHPDDREMVWSSIQKALDDKKRFELEYRIIPALGNIKWVWESGQGVFDSAGRLIALEGFITDITERIRNEIAAEKALAQSEALQEAMAELSSELDLSQVLRRILVTLKKVLPYNSAALFLYKEDRLVIVAARGFTNTSRLINKTFPVDNLLLNEIRRTKAPIVLKDAQEDPRFENWGSGEYVRGWMGVPLVRHDQFIGLLTIDNYKPEAYTLDDAYLARTFAAEAAIVIENARLYEKAQLLASTDALTGIFNRRYFYDIAAKEFERAKRYKTPLSVIMMDIDHFKYINDRYGHAAGDQVLIQFVQRIQKELRSSDIFARYGGEEFTILLPNIDLEHAVLAAERLRGVTSNKPFELGAATPYITLSLGVSEVEESCDIVDTLIDRGDKALYEAKQIGRNRVRAWNGH